MTVPAETKSSWNLLLNMLTAGPLLFPSKPFPLLDFSILSAIPSFPNTPLLFHGLSVTKPGGSSFLTVLVSGLYFSLQPTLPRSPRSELPCITDLLPLAHACAGKISPKASKSTAVTNPPTRPHDSSKPSTDSPGLTGSLGVLSYFLLPQTPTYLSL